MILKIKKLIPERLYDKIWHLFYDFWTFLFSFFPMDNKKITVSSFYGADYGDNGKCIIEELLKMDPSLKIVWVLKKDLLKNNHLPSGFIPVCYYSVKGIYHLETSAVWIDNARKDYGKKRKNQLYIQTWHGGPGMKRVEKDVADELGKRYVELAEKDSEMCDIILSNSRFMTNLFENVFWYKHEIIQEGSPRNDIFVNGSSEIRKKVYDFFKLDYSVKIVLYAPTFRKNKNLDVYNIDPVRTVSALSKKTGEKYVFFLRLHPNIRDKQNMIKTDDEIIYNATSYPDMQELLSAADCLITDYSSSNFDFSLTGRPSFIYASDIEEYKNNRGYYFSFDDMPFPLASDNDEMEYEILNFDEKKYYEDVKTFHEKLGVTESGKASYRAAEIIMNFIKR